MSYVAITSTPTLYHASPGAGSWTEDSIPSGTTTRGRRAFSAKYRRKTVVVGRFDPGLVWQDDIKGWFKLGVTGPVVAPTITAGAGDLDGTMIGYYSWVHKHDGRDIAESNPSPASDLLTLVNGSVNWSFPSTATDSRVTHVRLYRSVGGSLPRFVADVALGTTTYADNTDAEDLAAEITPALNALGTELDLSARGVPPYCRFVESFHDSVAYAGDPNFPQRVYLSRRYEPEAVNSSEVAGSWFDTLDGEAVTGIQRHGEELLVLCTLAAYAITGHGPADFSIRKISDFYGCISHGSLRRIGPHGDLWGAGREGIWIYNGVFRPAMEDLKEYWRDDYRLNKTRYEASIAADDRFFGGYKLLVPQEDETTLYYYGHYEPVTFGEQPWWLFDRRNRRDYTMGIFYGAGDAYGELVTGSCDGYVRKENVMDDDDDDGDTYQKAFDFTTKHSWLTGTQAGDDAQGGVVTNLDLYAKNDDDDIVTSLYCGDDAAAEGDPQWSKTLPASAESGRVSKTSHRWSDGEMQGARGKGASLRGRAVAPVGVEYRGHEINNRPGTQDRAFT